MRLARASRAASYCVLSNLRRSPIASTGSSTVSFIEVSSDLVSDSKCRADCNALRRSASVDFFGTLMKPFSTWSAKSFKPCFAGLNLDSPSRARAALLKDPAAARSLPRAICPRASVVKFKASSRFCAASITRGFEVGLGPAEITMSLYAESMRSSALVIAAFTTFLGVFGPFGPAPSADPPSPPAEPPPPPPPPAAAAGAPIPPAPPPPRPCED